MGWNPLDDDTVKDAAIGGAVAGPAGATIGGAVGGNVGGAGDIAKGVGDRLGMGAGPSLDDPRELAGQVKAVQVQPNSPFSSAQISQVGGPQRSDLRSYQVNLMNQLAQQANGQGPSLAQMQMQRAQQAALAQQQATLASQRGPVNPLAARTALTSNAEMNQNIAGQAGMARLQEQQQAQQTLAGVANQARGADDQMALAQYQGDLQRAVAQGQLDQRTAETMYQNQASVSAQNAANQQSVNMLPLQAALLNNQQNMAKQQYNDQRRAQGMGAFSQLAGSVGSLVSDERLKKNITEINDKDMHAFLDAMTGKNYKYKHPDMAGASAGDKTGPMAQNLQKTKIGGQMIQDHADGKKIDIGTALPSMMAAMAHMHERIKKTEKGSK